MKIWRLTIDDTHQGTCYWWAGSKKKVEAQLREERKNECVPMQSWRIDPLIIPNKKEELIRWLNTHFTRNNG